MSLKNRSIPVVALVAVAMLAKQPSAAGLLAILSHPRDHDARSSGH
jgi:hypothetical protein